MGIEEESESECEINIEGSLKVPNGNSHEWLVDFIESGGPKIVHEDIPEVVLFSLFSCDEVIQLFVVETNRYAEQVKERKIDGDGSSSRVTLWKPVTSEDIWAFVSILVGVTWFCAWFEAVGFQVEGHIQEVCYFYVYLSDNL